MPQLNFIVDATLKKYLGKSIRKLNDTLAHSLENRLTNFIPFKSTYKKAKKAFLRTYFTELLTMSHGNISKAATIANLNRRHIHRMCNELNIETTSFREKMIKPYIYLKENVKDLVEEKIEEFSGTIHPERLERVYSNLSKISENIAVAIETNTPSYENAIISFEKEYFGHVLKWAGFDVSKTAELSDLSTRSVFRKIRELGLAA